LFAVSSLVFILSSLPEDAGAGCHSQYNKYATGWKTEYSVFASRPGHEISVFDIVSRLTYRGFFLLE
jgi:hypothetical protein